MTAFKGEAGSPASPAHPELRKYSQLGASPFTARIYTVVAEAGDKGLTVKEIHQRLKDIPGFVSDTMRWAVETNQKRIGSTADTFLMGEKRIRERISNLIKDGRRHPAILNSHRSNGETRYTAGRPPFGYRPKMVPNTEPTGYVPIDLAAETTNSRSQIRSMQWLAEAKIEVENPKSRKLRALLAEAIEMIRAENN